MFNHAHEVYPYLLKLTIYGEIYTNIVTAIEGTLNNFVVILEQIIYMHAIFVGQWLLKMYTLSIIHVYPKLFFFY